jgi:putative Mg2+ transporter-C (MgtC) family protein
MTARLDYSGCGKEALAMDPAAHILPLSVIGGLLVRLCCAAVAGGVIGWNRHRAGKPAGIGTHALVALGAGLFVSIPAGFGADHVDALSRAIQGVAAGLGFLGAGEIFRDPGEGSHVTGLTSAAALWVTGALGIMIVSGPVLQSLGVTALVLLILELAPRLEGRLRVHR